MGVGVGVGIDVGVGEAHSVVNPLLPDHAARIEWLRASEEGLDNEGMLHDKYHFLGGDRQWIYCRSIVRRLGLEDGKLRDMLR